MAPRILFIEAAESLRATYREVFTVQGFELREAENGKRGLEIAASDHPDLIMLDTILPDMEGMEVLKQLKANSASKKIPVLVLSPIGGEGIKLLFTAGAADYAMKATTTPKEMLAKVNYLLAVRSRDRVALSLDESQKETKELLSFFGAEHAVCASCGGPLVLDLTVGSARNIIGTIVCRKCKRTL